jgi:DNA-binding transcriptional ArsR family regulator
MSSEPGEEGSIFTALGHEIRRNIIRILAEKGSRTFTELMDDLDIRDTGTMVFHLKRLGPLVSKNEKGEYILTSTGWKAYEILKEISGKRGPSLGILGRIMDTLSRRLKRQASLWLEPLSRLSHGMLLAMLLF